MFDTSVYKNRRAQLCSKMSQGHGIFIGHEELGMNAAANPYHFRQDSSFLYYFGLNLPGLVVLTNFKDGNSTLYGKEISLDDIVWTGEIPFLSDWAKQVGIETVKPIEELTIDLNKINEELHYLPHYRPDTKIKHQSILKQTQEEISKGSSPALIQAVVAQRSIKSPSEIIELDKAVDISTAMHLAAMRGAHPGMKEYELMAKVQEAVYSRNGQNSFNTILSINGQILHNHHYHNTMQEGDLMLCDCGAESSMHYAGDMTRTFPISDQFSPIQKSVYQIVLDAKNKATSLIKPGVSYRDIHLAACTVIAEGMKTLDCMKGNSADAVTAGAHALFFPHGLGHMMGMDVHDMEGIGENHVGYNDEVKRSDQFGLAFLRLGKKLEAGNVLTNEPGIYFIPQLLQSWKKEKKHSEFLNYDKIESLMGFGGIRLEDDYLVTENGSQVLGTPPPIEVSDVEEVRAEALS